MKEPCSLVLVGLLAACSPSGQAPGPGAAEATAPIDVVGGGGDDGARIAAIEHGLLPLFTIRGETVRKTPLAERMRQLDVPGVSVAVIDGGEVAWARGWGLADVASGRLVTAETLFQAASISKPVAAMAALRLVERGTIDLDEDVNDYLTSWQVPDNGYTTEKKVTLRGLLTHTAGTTVWGFPGYGPGARVPSTVGVLEGEGNTEPIRVFKEPGESWRYSGGGYTVLQQLLEDLSGRPFPELMQASVLEPAGMWSSTYEQPLPVALRGDAATGYRPHGVPVDGGYHTYPEMAAAGLWTTPTDLARFALAIQRSYAGEDETLLAQQTAHAMLTPFMNGQGLGPGIDTDGLRFGHGGANEGFRCQLTAFIEGGRGAVVMTNADTGGQLASEIILTIAAAYDWPSPMPEEKVVVRLDDSEYARLVGRYEVDDAGSGSTVVEVRYTAGRLVLLIPGSPELELIAESPTRFFVRGDGAAITFELTKEEVFIEGMGRRGRKVDEPGTGV